MLPRDRERTFQCRRDMHSCLAFLPDSNESHTAAELLLSSCLAPGPVVEEIQDLTEDSLEPQVWLDTLISCFTTLLILFCRVSHMEPTTKYTPLKATCENEIKTIKRKVSSLTGVEGWCTKIFTTAFVVTVSKHLEITHVR